MPRLKEFKHETIKRRRSQVPVNEIEARYKAIFDHSPYCIFLHDFQGKFLDANESALKLLGYRREDIPFLDFSSLLDKDQLPVALKSMKEIIQNGVQKNPLELKVRKKNGDYVWMEVEATLVHRGGKPSLIQGIANDITERKRVEEVSQESGERYRSLFERSRDAIYISSREGELLEVNQSMLDLFGYRREEMIGLNARETYVYPEDRTRFQKEIEQKGFVTDYEITLQKKDGTEMQCLLTSTVRRANGGSIAGYQGIIRDVTEKKQMEKELRNEKYRFQILSEGAPFGMVMIDQKGTFKYINPKFRELFGYDLNDVPDGRTWFRKAYPDSTYRHLVIATWLNDQESSIPGERRPRIFRAICKDGSEKIINFITVKLITGENLLACEDITERKRAEEALQYRVEFERLIMATSTRFIHLAPNGIDRGIQEALKQIGEFAAVDRSYVFLFYEDGKWMDNTHEWCAKGIKPQIHRLQRMAVDEQLPWFAKIIKRHDIFYVPRVADLPPEARAEKEEFEIEGIQSLIVVPMLYGDSLIGFIGFDSVRTEKTWSDEIISLLKIVGEIFVHALVRKQAEKQLRDSEEKYRSLVESTEDSIYLVDRECRYLFANEKQLSRRKLPKDQVIGRNYSDFHTPEESQKFAEKVDLVFETGGSIQFEHRSQKDGRYFIRTLSPTRDFETGKTKSVIVISKDITGLKQAEEALEEGEHFLSDIFTSIRDGISILDMEMNIVRVNPAIEQWYAHAMPLVGKKCYEAYHMRPDRCEVCPTIQTIRSGKAAYEVVPKIGAGGIIVGWTDLYSFPLIDANTGKMEGVIEYVRDITERKQAEDALQKSMEEARRLAKENAMVAEIGRILNSTLDIQEVYERFAEEVRKLIPFERISINLNNFQDQRVTIAYVAGGEVAERHVGDTFPIKGTVNEMILQTRSSILVLAEDEATLAERYPSLLTTYRAGFRSMISVPLTSKDQMVGALHIRSYQPNAYAETDLKLAERVSNQIAGAIANAQLFIERNRAEENYRSIFENAVEGIFQSTPEGRYIGVNPAHARIFGYASPEDMITGVTDVANQLFVDPEQYSVLKDLLKSHGVVEGFEFQAYRKDGERIWVSLSVRTVIDAEGTVSYHEGSTQDITERKRAEDKMISLEEQLRQAHKMEAIGRLAGGIAHDFNNLLTVIKGYAQLSLAEVKGGDPLKGNIEEIQKASDRAANLIRQLLAFSRRQILEMKIFDLNSILRDLDKMLRRILGEDIELVTLPAEGLGKVKTDPGQIEQVILNLAINARDAMPTGGKLLMETANVDLDEHYARAHIGIGPGRYVMFSISDTGCGMPPEVRERLFEPFFTTKEKGKGTGLGLSTVYGIVKQSGGEILVYSEIGKGTTFKIYLPRVEEEAEALLRRDQEDVFPQGTETVLLVEDETPVRDLAHRVLREQGYTVLETANGNEALSLARDYGGEIHLLLTDVVMPGMSGRELAERLHAFRPELKPLYMSGYTDNTIVHHCILDPDIAFLQKPFSPLALACKVREVLDK